MRARSLKRRCPVFAPWRAGPKDSISPRAQGLASRDQAPGPYLQASAPTCGLRSAGLRLERSAPCAPAAPGLCPASPSDSPGSWTPPSHASQSALRVPALARAAANERARHGPPPPGGRGKAGRGQSPASRGRRSRGPGGGTAKAGMEEPGCDRGGEEPQPSWAATGDSPPPNATVLCVTKGPTSTMLGPERNARDPRLPQTILESVTPQSK
ncbi:unnamed protein product [Rangifer tarandus platyrhynchus]|uniref:Uncharacterized protein n=1 Tax=Rangifer tarandus platyrhynchus TaxID=3082113 RepID=A0AC59ZPY9_RANTA